MFIESSKFMTKEWRMEQPWYINGKHNECEKYQRSLIEQITKQECPKTHDRIHQSRYQIQEIRQPFNSDDGCEWTENFDGKQEYDNGMILYYNLKMICTPGGAQTRSIREIYHFIKAQTHCVDKNTYFVNILDGDESYRQRSKFADFRSNTHIFIGDMLEFSYWYPSFTTNPFAQFYTVNYEYILQGLSIPPDITTIIEPFAGRGDLLKFLGESHHYTIECYDIDPKQDYIVPRDTLSDPPRYDNKFVLTNPPYLSRNKTTDKIIFDRYKTNDLYKCFLEELIVQEPCGGIIIVPLNFWCSSRKMDISLRRRFLNKFNIVRLNIFEEKVFEDTSYTVCSFLFERRAQSSDTYHLSIVIFPSKREMDVSIEEKTDYLIGGDIFHLVSDDKYTVHRLLDKDQEGMTRLLLKCIDDDVQINLRMLKPDEDFFHDRTPKHSERSYASIVIRPCLAEKEQEELSERFNQFLQEYRQRYHSLFLNNYREYGRKRITFGLAYDIIRHLLSVRPG